MEDDDRRSTWSPHAHLMAGRGITSSDRASLAATLIYGATIDERRGSTGGGGGGGGGGSRVLPFSSFFFSHDDGLSRIERFQRNFARVCAFLSRRLWSWTSNAPHIYVYTRRETRRSQRRLTDTELSRDCAKLDPLDFPPSCAFFSPPGRDGTGIDEWRKVEVLDYGDLRREEGVVWFWQGFVFFFFFSPRCRSSDVWHDRMDFDGSIDGGLGDVFSLEGGRGGGRENLSTINFSWEYRFVVQENIIFVVVSWREIIRDWSHYLIL